MMMRTITFVWMTVVAVLLVMASTLDTIHGFVAPSKGSIRRTSSSSSWQASSSSSATNHDNGDVFSSKGWLDIKEELDTIPVFVLADAQGKFCNETKVCFYCDVNAALKERAQQQQTSSSEHDIQVLPFPLGDAYRLDSLQQARLIPSDTQVKAAAAYGTTTSALQSSSSIPLFACMEITWMDENNKPVLPLFFIRDEVQAAVMEAVGRDGGNVNDFTIKVMTLSHAVETLLSSSSTDESAFSFMPPQASIQHIEQTNNDDDDGFIGEYQ